MQSKAGRLAGRAVAYCVCASLELTVGYHIMVGAVRPGLDHDKAHSTTNDVYFIDGGSGTLCGNGKSCADKQGRFAQGDRIGVLLDLDTGWMRFYRDGKRCGPGFTEGVTGPLVRAAGLFSVGSKVRVPRRVLPGAVAPEGAGLGPGRHDSARKASS